MRLRLFYLIWLFNAFSIATYAQPGNPGAGPIGGVIYLLLAGIGIGLFTLRKSQKKD